MSNLHHPLQLAFGFAFEDLYRREGLLQLDSSFLQHLTASDPLLFSRLMEARSNPQAVAGKQHSDLIVDLAPHVEDFIGELFGISREIRALQARHQALAPLYALKRRFVQKRAISGVTAEHAAEIDGPALALELEKLFGEPLTESSFVDHVSGWLESESDHSAEIQIASRYAAWAALSPAGIAKHKTGVLFKVPHKLDMRRLIPLEAIRIDGIDRLRLPEHDLRHREGFRLTDQGMDLRRSLDQANYCIKCHNQAKDSCSTGLKE